MTTCWFSAGAAPDPQRRSHKGATTIAIVVYNEVFRMKNDQGKVSPCLHYLRVVSIATLEPISNNHGLQVAQMLFTGAFQTWDSPPDIALVVNCVAELVLDSLQCKARAVVRSSRDFVRGVFEIRSRAGS